MANITMSRTLQYPPLTYLERAEARVSFSAQALRLMCRIELSAPEYEPGPEPRVARVPASLKSEWRVWGSEPGKKAKDIAAWSPEDFSAMQLFSDDHPFADKPLTEPPSASFSIRINNLEHYRERFWPTHHSKCYDHKAWPQPKFCRHGVPAPAKPPVLYLSTDPDCPFISIGDYVRHVRKWIEMDFVARDLHRAWSDMGKMTDGKLVADCSPCDGGIEHLLFTIKGRTKAQCKRLAEEYNSILARDDEVKDQYQTRRDRRTAELMKRNPAHLLAISKALARREDGFGFDMNEFEDGSDSEDGYGFEDDYNSEGDYGSDVSDSALPQKSSPGGALSQSGPSLSKRADPSCPAPPPGRYPSLTDLRLALFKISKPGKNTDVVFSLAADQLRWTVQLKRQAPGADKKASLKSVIQMRNCVKPYNMLPWNPSSNNASQPIVQPYVGSLTIKIGELVARESHWVKSHRKCYGEADVPEEICLCGEKRYIAPELTVEAAEGNDFVTVKDYVTSVTKWMEGDDVAGALAEEWFPDGSGGCKQARVELLDPAYLFLGLYEEKGCDLTEKEDKSRWMDVLVNHMEMAHDPWAEKSANISEKLRA